MLITLSIISTGGKSYPKTGSSGDGYKFARNLGLKITTATPALTPVYIKDFPYKNLRGISLNQCNVSLWRNNRKVRDHRGDIGFTHFGLSGPGILDFSRYLIAGDEIRLELINLRPEELLRVIRQSTTENGKMILKTFLRSFELPDRLRDAVLSNIDIDANSRLADLNRTGISKICSTFTGLPLIIERKGDYNVAMVTSGGVALSEIIPSTMQSRKVSGLYFAGEVADIDGDSGGYNLQAAFSTAFSAARSINKNNSMIS